MVRKYLNHQIDFALSMKSLRAKNNKGNNDVKKMFLIYFGCPLGDQDKTWAPHKICKKCCLGLFSWLNKRSSFMPFVITMI